MLEDWYSHQEDLDMAIGDLNKHPLVEEEVQPPSRLIDVTSERDLEVRQVSSQKLHINFSPADALLFQSIVPWIPVIVVSDDV